MKRTTIITKSDSSAIPKINITENQVLNFVEKADHITINDIICGKLQFIVQNGITYTYKEVANGCVWVYLTDCNGNVESGIQHQCIAGNFLNVDGCHAFGCNC